MHYIALYALYCIIITYQTVNVHLLQMHLLIFAIKTDKNIKYLSLNNPLRQILLSSEINAINVLITDSISLASIFDNTLNYTFPYTNNEIIQMMTDYYQICKNDFLDYVSDTLYPNLNLSEQELNCKPFNTYEKYRQIYISFVCEFVDKLTITQETINWIQQTYPDNVNHSEILKNIGSNVYDTDISQNVK